MGELFTIENVESFPKVLDIIHDSWFDKDDIEFNSESSCLKIKFDYEQRDDKKVVGKFLFFKRVMIPIVEYFLIIHNVEDFQVYDDEKKDAYYYFNELKFDPEQKQITITTDFSFEIYVYVSKLRISVKKTDKLIKEKKTFSF